jgi:hypothetical protein
MGQFGQMSGQNQSPFGFPMMSGMSGMQNMPNIPNMAAMQGMQNMSHMNQQIGMPGMGFPNMQQGQMAFMPNRNNQGMNSQV